MFIKVSVFIKVLFLFVNSYLSNVGDANADVVLDRTRGTGILTPFRRAHEHHPDIVPFPYSSYCSAERDGTSSYY